MCVYVCTCVHEKRIVGEYMFARWLNVCVCVVDVEIQKKLSRPKGSKANNFVATMKVFFLLAVSFPMSSCCVAVSACLKLCVAIWELRTLESMRECCCQERKITRFPNHVTGSKWKIYFSPRQVPLEFKRTDVVENTSKWLFCSITLPKPLISFWRRTIFVSGTSILQVILFFKNFSLSLLFAGWSEI